MTTEVAPDEKKITTCFIAGYLIDAHGFALLSEEEAGTMLTKRDSWHERDLLLESHAGKCSLHTY